MPDFARRGPAAEIHICWCKKEIGMKCTNARKAKIRSRIRKSPAEAAEQAGYGPKITVECGFLVLRWSREQAAEAMDSAGMSPEELLRIYLIPRLESTKTICLKHRGQITQKYQDPDWNARFDAAKLTLQIMGVYPEE
jgi:hypothetical protein